MRLQMEVFGCNEVKMLLSRNKNLVKVLHEKNYQKLIKLKNSRPLKAVD